ncbi:peptidase [Micromonospora sp. NPDC049523]|uniref:peptidase n=1 Tax=Micromonospora sp. NPDC049523 TaxID=3155921 RepID=UPI00341C8795
MTLKRVLRGVGAGVAALLVAGTLTGVAGPAQAAEAKPELDLSFQNDAIVNNTPTTIGTYINNRGDAPATGVVVTFDASAVADKVDISVPDWNEDCKLDGAKIVCQYGSLAPGQSETIYAITLASKPRVTPGDAGSVQVTIKSTEEDGAPGNNTVPLPVTIVASGPDLVALADDLGSETDRVGPGDTVPVLGAVQNEGDTATTDISVSWQLPGEGAFVERYDDCEYTDVWPGTHPAGYVYGPSWVTCVAPLVLQPGETALLFDPATGESLFNATFGKNLLGPDSLYGFLQVGLADEESVAQARKQTKGGPSFAAKLRSLTIQTSKAKRAAAARELDDSDNIADFQLWTKPNTIDFSVTAEPVTGAVGDVVEVPYTVVNNGPSDGGAGWKVVAPSGTVLLPSEWCYERDADGHILPESTTQGCSIESFFPSTASGYGRISSKLRIKIKSTPGTNGTITVDNYGPATESKHDNDVAKIVLGTPGSNTPGTGDGGSGDGGSGDGGSGDGGAGAGGGLPVTGVQAGLLGGVGGAALIAGATLFLLARRRRLVLVVPSEDGTGKL